MRDGLGRATGSERWHLWRLPGPGSGSRLATHPLVLRWSGPLTVGLLGAAAIVLGWALASDFGRTFVDWDRAHYIAATIRWLETGTPYVASEVAAPFDYGPDTFLHPPIALLLFLPFVWLPPFLWYAIPIGFTAWSIAGWRPERWTWPVMAACLAWPRTSGMLIVGNTDLWMMAIAAAGLRWAWPWILVVIKPSFAPLMLMGVRHRSWWIALAVLVVVALPFGGLWGQWLAVLLHAPGGLLYSVLGLPLVLLPIVAWAGRRAPDGDPVQPSG